MCPLREGRDVVVMRHVQVPIGDHGPASIPAPIAHNMNSGDVEGIGRAHDRPDIEIVLPVLNSDVERVAPRIQVGDDFRQPPVAVLIDDVAPVAMFEKVRI